MWQGEGEHMDRSTGRPNPFCRAEPIDRLSLDLLQSLTRNFNEDRIDTMRSCHEHAPVPVPGTWRPATPSAIIMQPSSSIRPTGVHDYAAQYL
uniref:Uncharacterized protein n=1 Tax=Arundo donax TaxID=35708 RepID=A0A0A9A0E3_ARUDO